MKEPIQLPPKPTYGSPCNHCGVCCIRQLCFAAELAYPNHAGGPCPDLIIRDGKALCGIVLAEEAYNLPKTFTITLGIGLGCSMRDDDSNSNPNP